VWSLNSLLTRRRVTTMLEQFKEQGMGGVFVLPRWGLVTGFLTEEWFEMWGHALKECKRLGLGCQIYDEFLCPAGHAGGHVPAEAPHTAARFLRAVTHTQPQRPVHEGVAAVFAFDRDMSHPRRVTSEAIRNAGPDQPVVVFGFVEGPAEPGAGGFPYPDLTRHDAIATFLRVGYEPYAKRFGREFGKTVRYAFSDESCLPASRHGILWSELMSREFWKDHGYRLEDRLPEFCFGQGESTAVRFDYFSTLCRLYCTNFSRQIAEWCEAHGLLHTGHYYEEHWPNPIDTPSAMAQLRWMHAPGNDYLAFQYFPDNRPANRRHLYNLRELSSVANQLGRAKTMVEASGAGGYSISFATFKGSEDLLLAHGVNVMNPHLSHVSLAGMRQYEWPQTISDHSSWFPWYRLHADHVARVAAVLSEGREVNRVLLLQPTTTMWMRCSHHGYNPGQEWTSAELTALARMHDDVLFALADGQVDFDLGDEMIMAELGRAAGGRLTVGKRTYDLVVMSGAMQNLTESTLALLTRYLATGGRLLRCGSDTLTHVNGRENDAPKRLLAEHAGKCETLPDPVALAERVRQLVPPRVADRAAGKLPSGLLWRRAELAGGDAVWFFCNPWTEPLKTEVRIAGAQLVDLDTGSGEMHALPAEADSDTLVAPLTLHPRGHALWLSRRKADPRIAPRPAPFRAEAVALGELTVAPTHPNQLLIDYCDLESGDVHLEGTTTYLADEANWRVQGFRENPWKLGTTQFNRNFIDHEVDPRSAFRVTYRFEVDERLPAAQRAGLALGVERPWLYTVRVNGRVVRTERAPCWFDEHMRRLAVGKWLRPGSNTVELCAARFNMLCEIKPIYILGEFGLEPVNQGFRIVPQALLTLGDWTTQGLPFYPHGIRYAWRIALSQPAEGLRLTLGDWAGSVAAVQLNGREEGAILHPPFVLDIAKPVPKGEHIIAVTVIGNMRNMLGPHFSEGHAGPWSWRWGAPESQPPGGAYARQKSGLLEAPRVEALHG